MDKEIVTNSKGEPIVVGCNYHTTWQSHKAMRFILEEIKGDKARLKTTKTYKDFWTSIEDLIFIKTDYNTNKAKKLVNNINLEL